jgi:hypothetical protein
LAEIWVTHLELKKMFVFLAEELSSFFTFEILVSKISTLTTKTYYIKKHFIFLKNVNIFLWLFCFSYDQKLSSLWTEKKFAANITTNYPFRIGSIVQPHLYKP